MKAKTLLGSIAVLGLGATFVLSEFAPDEHTGYEPRYAANSDAAGAWLADEIFVTARTNANTGRVESSDMIRARQQVQRRLNKRSALNLNWNEMGPANIGGRTRTVLVDKDNSNRIYAGGIGGGIFISDNAGGRWRPYDDLMENLLISSMAQSSNGDIYVGTGSSFEGSAPMPGAGIFKSSDGGESFVQLSSTDPTTEGNQWTEVNRIVVDPNNPTHIYAGTHRGLYSSNDGGATWVHTMAINPPTCNVLSPGEVQDLEFTPSGRLIVGYGGGVYTSDDPQAECSYELRSNGIPASNQRIDIDFCPLDENIVYAITTTGGFLENVYESDDRGTTWSTLDPAPPTATIDSTFRLFGDNGQGDYDLALEVFPGSCERIMIGGVQLYRVAGSWSRVAEIFAPEFSGVYVHADVHYFEFDPKNPNTLYIGSDGGIGKTENAADLQPEFFTANRGYNVTQFYGIAFTTDGRVLGGTQDNGTLLIDPSIEGESGMDAFQVQGGDGFDCEVSNIGAFAFATSQFNALNRLKDNAAQTFLFDATDPYFGEGLAPFHSVVRLWESTNDSTSQDSITFNNDTLSLSLAKGNGSRGTFQGTFLPVQSAAQLIQGTVSFSNRFGSVSETIRDVDGNGNVQGGTLYSQNTGDSVGFYNYTTGDYRVRFQQAPPDQSDVIGKLAATYDAGDTLRLLSTTADYPFTFILPVSMNVGDSVRVQDPVQSILASVVNGGVVVTRGGLREGTLPEWFDLRALGAGSIGTPKSIEFSADGNHMYYGTYGGSVFRISGFNNLYNIEEPVTNVLTRTQIMEPRGGVAHGLVVHPFDPNKLLVTVGGYGNGSHIFELTNAELAPSAAAAGLRDVQGDLVDMPAYDAEYNIEDPSIVLVGTDFGIWSTPDIDAANVEWFNENANLANTPVFDIRQQRLAWNQAENSQIFYVGTHGRGIWSTGDFVNSTPDFDGGFADKADLGLKVYPNPAQADASVEFTLAEAGNVELRMFDLQGKLVRNFNSRSYQEGSNVFRFNVSDMPAGTYFLTVNAGSQYSMSKFVVFK